MNLAESPPSSCRSIFAAERATRSASSGSAISRCDFKSAMDSGHCGQHGDALAANGFNQARRGEALFKMQLGGEDGWNPEAHGLAKDMAQRQGVQNAQRMRQYSLPAHVGPRARSMGPTLASTLPWVSTIPFGSSVVPEVNRISSGVDADRSAMGPASSAGSSANQSSNARR